jgi:hypothetical protein
VKVVPQVFVVDHVLVIVTMQLAPVVTTESENVGVLAEEKLHESSAVGEPVTLGDVLSPHSRLGKSFGKNEKNGAEVSSIVMT